MTSFPTDFLFVTFLIIRNWKIRYNSRKNGDDCKSMLTLRRSIDGWAGQLSTNRTIFHPSLVKRLSTSRTHSSNNMLSIQLFYWLRYRQDKCFICLKHRSFLDLPITNKGNFSPIALAAVNPVRRRFKGFSFEN